MKTLNTKKGYFAGNVLVHDKVIYIDTSNGTGFQKVFENLSGTILKLSHFGACNFGSFEDAKQEICLVMLEGILKYKPDKDASLSTFLYRVGYNRIIDQARKNIRGRTRYLMIYDDSWDSIRSDPDFKIELGQRTKNWDDKWKRLMFRIYVKGDAISDVAKDEEFTPWGLTRAIRRKLKEARKV